jgi:hypothetical protein
MHNLIPTTNQLTNAKRFLEGRDWYETERGWTHPDHSDEFYSLEDAYRYELGLVALSIPQVTKGKA